MPAKPLTSFRYLSFDVVGTLIDFESGLIESLRTFAAEDGVDLDSEAALGLYRAARHSPQAQRFPDDLARVYAVLAPQLGLRADPARGARLVEGVAGWQPFADSVAALAELRRHFRLIAMTNARRWAFAQFDRALGQPFHAAFTPDETGTEKPDPAFFEAVFAFVAAEGAMRHDILHVAQSQYHDIGVSRDLGMTNCWVERRHARPGPGGTIAPGRHTIPDHHVTSLAGLVEAIASERV